MRLAGGIELQQQLAEGGMGGVWRARATLERRDVAVKVLLRRFAKNPRFRQVFLDEVAVVAAMRHPNIVPVLAFGTLEKGDLPSGFEGSPYLVMPLASGHLADRHRDWAELLDPLRKVLDALAHLHANGIVHRDLKPPNVLLGDDVWLADFGVALRGPTAYGVVGTPAFMAPEQARGFGWEQGPWTDLYAFGASVWTLVTGRFLFPDLPVPEILEAQQTREPGAFEPFCEVPGPLEDWLRWLLQKDASARPQSVAEAVAAFPTLARGNTRAAAPVPPPLIRAGAELLTLRPPAFVGRTKLRKAGVRLLQAAATEKKAVSIGLWGPPGIGKTRLARHLSTEAHVRLGYACHVLQSPEDFAHSALKSLLRLRSVPRPSRDAHLASRANALGLHESQVDRWSALLDRGSHQATHAERAQTVLDLLSALATRNPVLIVVDDVIDDPTLKRVMERLTSLRAPIALISTAKTGKRWGPLDLHRRLRPVAHRTIRTLVQSVVQADPVFLDRLAERAAGHPGLAIDCLIELWNTGNLANTGSGFVVDGDVALPRVTTERFAPHAQWLRRKLPREEFTALLALAALRASATDPRWERLCAHLEVPTVRHVCRSLAAQGRMLRTGNGWAFDPPQLGEAVLAEGEKFEISAPIQRGALLLLMEEKPRDPAALSAHAEAVKNWGLTFNFAHEALMARLFRGDFRSETLLLRVERAAHAVRHPARQVEATRLRAVFERLRGRMGRAEQALSRAFALAGTTPTAELYIEQARHHRQRGDLEAVIRSCRTALDVASGPKATASASLALAEALRTHGERDAARRAYQQVIDFGEAARPIHLCGAFLGAAMCEDAAEPFGALMAQARKIGAKHGFTEQLALIHERLGERLRLAGRLEEAAEQFENTLDLQRRSGSSNVVYSHLNLALIGFHRGRPDTTRAEIRNVVRAGDNGAIVALYTHTLWLWTENVRSGDLKGATAAFVSAVQRTGYWDPDLQAVFQAVTRDFNGGPQLLGGLLDTRS